MRRSGKKYGKVIDKQYDLGYNNTCVVGGVQLYRNRDIPFGSGHNSDFGEILKRLKRRPC